MTALNVSDEIYRLTSETAAAQGKSVDEFVVEALRQALSAAGVRRTTWNGLQVMVVNNSRFTIDPRKVRQCLEEEGF